MGGVQARMESALARLLPPAHIAPARLHEAMRYATLEGGKRVRPLLAFAAGEVSGAAPERLEVAAAAVEMIHAYSLVHDDLPCMDDDVLRRGKPTVHVEFDEATALLVGDALQSLAFQLLSEHPLADDPRVRLEMMSHPRGGGGLARHGGRAGRSTWRRPARRCRCPSSSTCTSTRPARSFARRCCWARCGALSAEERSFLDRYAKAIGLAFQVVDDVLDSEASTATLGKTAGKDSKQGKATYVSLLGAARAKEMAEGLRAEAHAALEPLAGRAARLRRACRLHRSAKILG